jgi:trans-2,3-dihydro-3-hydroxyanthranilate isomerase
MAATRVSNPRELQYVVADVFTTTAFAGNAVAVVFDSLGLPTVEMQRIAREFNLSETTFVERRPAAVEHAEGVRVRIFTTQEELPFAGHPTLGTAYVLRTETPEAARDGVITLALNVGQVPVRFVEDRVGAPLLYGEMTQPDPKFGTELDASRVALLTGLDLEDLDPGLPPQVVSTGTAFAIVVLRTVDGLARLRVSQAEANSWLRPLGARWFYVMAPTGSRAPDFRARMQFNGGEDPATGSAAGCAIGYLVDRGVVDSGREIHVRQGVEISRSSDLFLSARRTSAKIGEVRVGGSTVLVARGRLFLP